MRTRFKPYARPELNNWPYFIQNPQEKRARWEEVYASGGPLHIELGCGKGTFLATQAMRNPTINYLGIDIKNEMLVVAKRNTEKMFSAAGSAPENLRICAYNIEKIDEILGSTDTVSRIYINFCNPWYKSGHAKHRLTHPRQLFKYRSFLLPNAEIHFKTDDRPLFEDTLRYLPYTGFEVLWQTRNLHENEPAGNIRTEHEEMFAAEGCPIYACRAVIRPAQLEKDHFFRLKNI